MRMRIKYEYENENEKERDNHMSENDNWIYDNGREKVFLFLIFSRFHLGDLIIL